MIIRTTAMFALCTAGLFAAGEISTAAYNVPTPKALPEGVTSGPDGNVWFTENGAPQIGRVIPSTGVITEFVLPDGPDGAPWDIITGPDGALWYTDTNTSEIGRMTTDGTVTNLYKTLTPNSAPRRMTIGQDGAIWFTEYTSNQIGRITVDGTVTEYPIATPNSKPAGIAAGPDNAIWFCENFGNQIARMTLDGVITNTYPVPTPSSVLAQMILGPDNNMWFSENRNNKVGRIIPSTGVITEFEMPTPGSVPGGLIAAPDGAMWITEWESSVSQIGRITTDGLITEYPDGVPGSEPWEIAVSPDGKSVWWADWSSNGMSTAPICALGLTASYDTASSTLKLGFDLGVAQPGLWVTWIKENGDSVKELWSKKIPAEIPAVSTTVPVSFASTGGIITVASEILNAGGALICEENASVSTAVQVPTSTALTSSPNPSKSGEVVKFTAAVTPSSATGTVTFYHSNYSLGTATLKNGVASLSVAPPSQKGPHEITAGYLGDANDAPSTSPVLEQIVK